MAERDLAGACVVITGASSGIGRAAARAFTAAGAHVVLAGRSRATLLEVANECRRHGGSATVVETDVGQAEAMARLADFAVRTHGRLDVWVNNAGVFSFGPFVDTPVAAHDQVIRTNVLGYLYGAHAALPHFLRQGQGVLINLVSLAGWAPTPMASTYSASKFGVRGLAEGLRVELAGHPGVKICDLSPAFVDTPMIDHLANYAGRKPLLVPPVIATERVARAIVALARRPRDSRSLGILFRVSVASHALAPRLFRAIVGRGAKVYLRLAGPAARQDGTLFRPAGQAGAVSVGRRSPALQALGLAAVAGLAGLVMARALRRA